MYKGLWKGCIFVKTKSQQNSRKRQGNFKLDSLKFFMKNKVFRVKAKSKPINEQAMAQHKEKRQPAKKIVNRINKKRSNKVESRTKNEKQKTKGGKGTLKKTGLRRLPCALVKTQPLFFSCFRRTDWRIWSLAWEEKRRASELLSFNLLSLFLFVSHQYKKKTS